MKEKLNKFNFYTSLFFILVFTIPTIIQSSLFFKNHTHEVCEISETHLHEKINTCSLCDFTFSEKKYLLNKIFLPKIILNFNFYSLNYKLLFSIFIDFFDSRGPPKA